MNLTQEQQINYIRAMDLDIWYPRVQLINAQPTVQFLKSSTENRGDSPETNVEITDTDKTIESQFKAPELPRDFDNKNLASDSSVKAPGDANLPTDKPIRFGLALYVIDDWMVCSSLVSNYQDYEEASAKLIYSVLKTLGSANLVMSHHHIISWPFFSNANASQGVLPAQQYVNGVIEHLLGDYSVTKLLVCGGVLAKLNSWTSIEGDEFGLKRVIIPSVYKMLSDPQQKAKAWEVIQSSSLYQSL